jgi:hypothetical protein
MTIGIISSTEPEIVDLEDELADFTGDVLALKTYEPSLARLFKTPAGMWSDLATLLERDQQAVEAISTLQSDCQGTLRVTWLDHPDLELGYCLVLFYMDALGWNSLALYNRGRFV